MSIKINFMHYMKWARVMVPVVFEKFEPVCIFLLFFLFTVSVNWQKVNFWQKSGGGGRLLVQIKINGSSTPNRLFQAITELKRLMGYSKRLHQL